jgi:hypothetical protein
VRRVVDLGGLFIVTHEQQRLVAAAGRCRGVEVGVRVEAAFLLPHDSRTSRQQRAAERPDLFARVTHRQSDAMHPASRYSSSTEV